MVAKIVFTVLISSLLIVVSGLYEDQAGKFDWLVTSCLVEINSYETTIFLMCFYKVKLSIKR